MTLRRFLASACLALLLGAMSLGSGIFAQAPTNAPPANPPSANPAAPSDTQKPVNFSLPENMMPLKMKLREFKHW